MKTDLSNVDCRPVVRRNQHGLRYAAIDLAQWGAWHPVSLTARTKRLPDHHEDIARRFVACWKACAGISTEDLERGRLADLLAALEEIRVAQPPERPNGYLSYQRLANFMRGRAAAALKAFKKGK